MPSPWSRTLGGPFELALAKAVPAVPTRAETLYESKFDGFRVALVVEDDGVMLFSRNGTDLTARFPELAAAAAEQVPPDGCVLDGEAVIWGHDRLDFDALQRRMGAGPATARRLAAEQPASFVAFDVLAVLGRDVRAMPLSDRRRLLEELAAGFSPPLELSHATTDRAEAMRWWDELARTGIEGLMAKSLSQPYRGAERAWSKIKRRDDTDSLCGAVIGPRSRPRQLVLGAWDTDGRLRFTGRTALLTAVQASAAAEFLKPPAGGHPWPEEVPATAFDRFARDRGPVRLTLVEPVVVEVSADSARSGVAFRHSVRLARFRPDLDPTAVRIEIG
ncbi:DNA ligase (plasmid) [Sinomonas atrocyanea]|uniref:DNA ligase n=1 Tax=Sinomonas atrocyanea TaxID=37927 RepID=A0A127A7K0_9MICC|nr:ATP-dependent DNA ligase [Sinomonas atrocyanea]AMM34754.1 DNA ligase [Sinomonas atrocyanea]GEB66246.1 ATP-dependent DNA ligase [Sinomonas atrocyanea]